MLFTLKKVIGNMLLPLPLMLLIIGAGLALLWFSRFQKTGNDSNLLIVFYVQIMPDDFVMQLHRF